MQTVMHGAAFGEMGSIRTPSARGYQAL